MSDTTPATVPATEPGTTPQAGTTPPTPAAEPPKMFPEEHVKQLRQEAAEARTKLREEQAKTRALEQEKMTDQERKDAQLAEFKTRAEEAEKQLAERDMRLLRAEAVNKHKLPASWIDRLKGTTAAELDADAAEVAKDLKPPAAPNAEGGEHPRLNTKQSIAKRVDELRKSGEYTAL